MLLSGGKYHLRLSEREMSQVLDALDVTIATMSAAKASGFTEQVSTFSVDEFDGLRSTFQRRFDY